MRQLSQSQRPIFELSIYIPPEMKDLRNKYITAINQHNRSIIHSIIGDSTNDISNQYFNAGFDLFSPSRLHVEKNKLVKINHQVICAMRKFKEYPIITEINDDIVNIEHVKNSDNSPNIGYPVSYYLYPRSSVGTKTPLRLANSVGIIDSGYRGNIIAAFDNISDDTYVIEQYQRLVQICPPDISHPIFVRLVDNLHTLGITERDSNGFGSTGR